MEIIIPTTTIKGDEKAWSLAEVHEQSPRNRGFHRYQKIKVMREGKLATFKKDMGLAKNFKGINPLAIPSFFEHTVDELLDIADEIRGHPKIDIKDFLELNSYKPA